MLSQAKVNQSIFGGRRSLRLKAHILLLGLIFGSMLARGRRSGGRVRVHMQIRCCSLQLATQAVKMH